MSIEFKKVSDFSRGILFELLSDAYSYDKTFLQRCSSDWKACDDFVFDYPKLAEKCSFVTTVNNEAIGFIIWDPRNMPESVEIGHNCIATKYKGNGYSKIQLQEAVNRIMQQDVKKITVTTNTSLLPAQHMYEKIGFKRYQTRENDSNTDFAGDFIDYVYYL